MLLGGSQMPGETFIQVEGSGFRIDAQFMKENYKALQRRVKNDRASSPNGKLKNTG